MIDYSLYSLESIDELKNLANQIKLKAELNSNETFSLSELATYLAKLEVYDSLGNDSLPIDRIIQLTAENSILELKSDLENLANIIRILSGYTNSLKINDMAYLVQNFSLGTQTIFSGQRILDSRGSEYSIEDIDDVVFKVYRNEELIGSYKQHLSYDAGGCGDDFKITIQDVIICGDDLSSGGYYHYSSAINDYIYTPYIKLKLDGEIKGKKNDIFKIEIEADPSGNIIDSFEVSIGEETVLVNEEIPTGDELPEEQEIEFFKGDYGWENTDISIDDLQLFINAANVNNYAEMIDGTSYLGSYGPQTVYFYIYEDVTSKITLNIIEISYSRNQIYIKGTISGTYTGPITLSANVSGTNSNGSSAAIIVDLGDITLN